MIHVKKMGKFVLDDIVLKVTGQKHDEKAESDVPLCTATPPTTSALVDA